MHISLVGINHHTAPVAVREKAAIGNYNLDEALAGLRMHVPHGVILSTCNRTEIYCAHEDEDDARQAGLNFLKARLNAPDNVLDEHVYILDTDAAVEHLFRVAGGLESLVVGEFEVLGQVRKAMEAAERAAMVHLPLRYIFNSAIRAGREVREATGISKNPISVSSVAIDLAAKKVVDLTKCKMLVIGAGEAGRLVAKVARERGTSQIVVGSRTRERAREVAAALNGRAIDLETLGEELRNANIVVTCATAPHRLVSAGQIEKIMEGRTDQPLVIIDIAVPRNVEPEVGQIENVFLYTIDDLTEISNANRKSREGAIQQAEAIIGTEFERFINWRRDFEVRPLIGSLMGKAEEIRSTQLKRTIKDWPPLSEEQMESLEAMTMSIVNRILQDPIEYLKNGGVTQSEVVKKLFKLDVEKACEK
jgi:glutamyl-tRNA reductase